MNRDEIDRDAPLLRRVRDSLDRTAGLSPGETARLARARQAAVAAAGVKPGPARLPAYGLALAASVMLVAGLLLLRPDGLDPLPPQLAELDDPELLLAMEEAEWAGDPELLAWALDAQR
jgi:hypothetical protein